MSFLLFLVYLAATFIFPGELFPELAPYRITFWLGVISLTLTILTVVPTGRLTVRAWPIGLVAGLILSMMLSVIWADKWLGAALFVIESFGPALTLFLLAVWNVTSLRRLGITAAVLVVSILALAAQGIAAYHFGYMQDKLLLHQGEDSPPADNGSETKASDLVRVRGLGQVSDPNDLALVLVATLPFLGLAWKERRAFRNIVVVGVPGALIVYGVYLTRSRGGMLGVLAVLFATLVQRVSRTKALLATAAMAAVLVAANFTGGRAISTSDDSAEGRVEAWSEGLDMLRSNPVLGVGFRNFTEHNSLTAHNSFVLCFAELGVVGYFFWMGLLVVAILQIQEVRRSVEHGFEADRLRQHAQLLNVAFSGVLVTAFFLSRTYNPVLYLFVGLALALYTLAGGSGLPVALLSGFGISRKVVALEFTSIIIIYTVVRANRILNP